MIKCNSQSTNIQSIVRLYSRDELKSYTLSDILSDISSAIARHQNAKTGFAINLNDISDETFEIYHDESILAKITIQYDLKQRYNPNGNYHYEEGKCRLTCHVTDEYLKQGFESSDEIIDIEVD